MRLVRASSYGKVVVVCVGIISLLAWKFVSLGMALTFIAYSYLSAIDILDQKVPDILLLVIGIVFSAFFSVESSCFAGAISCFIVLLKMLMEKTMQKRLLGWGDIKLIGISLCFLPVQKMPQYFFLSGITAMIFFVVFKLKNLPFVPFLSVAFLVSLLTK